MEAQKKERPYRCGFVFKSEEQLNDMYNKYYSAFGCKKGESIASIGAAGGANEVSVSAFVDSIAWTIQDIDTSCLNKTQLNKIVHYTENLKNKTIKDSFEIVIGNENSTKLKDNFYDRILITNTYHELTDKVGMLKDIYSKLKPNGCLVVTERMANKKGEVRKDCNHIMPLESDLLMEFNKAGYHLVTKKNAVTRKHSRHFTTVYTFEKKQK